MPLRTQILTLLILAQVWLSTSKFVFELEVDIDSVTAGNFNCDIGRFDGDPQCRIYFPVFCLRERRGNSRSTNEEDCPLGRNANRMNAYEPNGNTRRITSQGSWPISFQLYFKAKDSDPNISNDDDLDDIFIDRTLVANTGFTGMEEFSGIHSIVSFRARFRVMCQQDYYGANCSTHCVAHNDDMNGHYTCNSDGSFQCLEGFENPNNNCRDMINPCNFSPCVNGSCIPIGPFDYTCQCAVGYTGHNCEANVDDCLYTTCPNNSICVDTRCVQIPVTRMETQGTPVVGSFTTSSASKAESGNKNTSPTVVAIAVTVALIVISLIIFTVVLIVVIIKWRRKKTHSKVHRDGKWMESLSAKMVDNPIYEQPSESDGVIYEAPKRTSLEATVLIVDNPIYGEDADYNPVNDETIREVQNPIYGDNVNRNTLLS